MAMKVVSVSPARIMKYNLSFLWIAIQAPLSIPPVHPKDKPLLRPLSEIGKMKYATGGHSFLRRTEYIATGDSRARETISNRHVTKSSNKKRKQVDTSKDDPVNILRATVKGFDIAYPEDKYTGPDGENNKIRGSEPTVLETEAWNKPAHPTNPELKLLDSYPLLPDLDAFPDSGSYQTIKFTANPTQATEVRDARMDVGLLSYMEASPQEQAVIAEDYKSKVAAHHADPTRNPMPGPMLSYRFFLPQNEEGMRTIKRKLDTDELDNDDPEAEPEQVRFDHLRVYETSRSVVNPDFPYKDVALALHDPEMEEQPARASDTGYNTARSEKAAFYYPLGAKLQLKPRRNRNLAQLGLAGRIHEEDEDIIDGVYVSVRESSEGERQRLAENVRDVDPTLVES